MPVAGYAMICILNGGYQNLNNRSMYPIPRTVRVPMSEEQLHQIKMCVVTF